MRHVPKADRASWHSRAMEVADSAELGEAVSLWLETRETDRLVDRLRRTPPRVLKGLSHCVTELAARRLEKAHPDVAAWEQLLAAVHRDHRRKAGFLAALSERPNPGSNAPASAGRRDGERPGPPPASTGYPASRSVRTRSGRRPLPAG